MENKPDFVALARDTYPSDGSFNQEKGDLLWAAMFHLKEWLFLMTPKSMEQGQPSLQQIDGNAWYLVFTDSDKLRFYAEQNHNLDASGNALFMTMTPDKATEFAQNCLNLEVFGIRFNEGQEYGWFSPMRNITLFPNYLKDKNLI